MSNFQQGDSKSDDLSHVLGSIYDAALDPSFWPDALSSIAQFIGVQRAAFYNRSSQHEGNEIRCTIGIEPLYAQILFDSYLSFGPGTGDKTTDNSKNFFSTSLPVSPTGLEKNNFYEEWMHPLGLTDLITVTIQESQNKISALAIFRDQPDETFGHEARRRIELILPHIHRATSLHKKVDSRGARVVALSQTIDLFNMGIYVTNADGCILHSNATGRAMIAAGDTLYLAGGRLAARSASSNKAIRRFFTNLHKANGASGPDRLSLSIISTDGAPYVSRLLPLNLAPDEKLAPAAILFIRKANLDMSLNLDVVGEAFKLTPTEIRVLSSIVDIGGAPEAAAALGVAITTVKTHLGRLFEKTGATRQADLVKLAAAYAMPLIE